MSTRLMDAASRLAPRATVRTATAIMLIPGRRMRVRPEQAEVMRRARRETLAVGPHRIAVHRWGSGPRRVLLVHGWKGRSAQWAALAARLEGEASVVAFDAPAHGDSRGLMADIGMWIEALRALDAEAGGFDVVVAHSFGALAALRARRAGLLRGAIVSIAAPPSADAVFGAYASQIGMTDAGASEIATTLARRLGPVMSAIAMGRDFDAAGAADAALLVVHDRDDRVIPPAAARAVAATWPGPSTVLTTEGLGHNRILAAPDVLDAVGDFIARPQPAADPTPVSAAGVAAHR